ncbi:MAG: hypothetical protein MZV63_46045 [Marinilabiliales bacterium]|nr:hypothetical protein [Marinilabiliales bacterium]
MNGDPCVIISTSGMLNGGPVMEYLLNLAQDEKNALVFVGYSGRRYLRPAHPERLARGADGTQRHHHHQSRDHHG